ncbi:hypothetical protein ACRALDRAFT_2017632 [Sodiomyces alcalophilus JCM 7366]|uniref:uncharacterized protein n=1 Tax=Sodiomyces alcalophilus JCM 7366 TaxID=591952 RepID=UPI0039B38A43
MGKGNETCMRSPETCVPFVREQNKEYCLALRLMGTRLRDVAWSLKQVTASNAMMQEQAGDDDNGIPIKASPLILATTKSWPCKENQSSSLVHPCFAMLHLTDIHSSDHAPLATSHPHVLQFPQNRSGLLRR